MNSIEIADSDEEGGLVSLEMAALTAKENERTPKKQPISTPVSSASSETISPSTGLPTGRQRCRKTQHQTLRITDTDMRFETLDALEEGQAEGGASAPKQPRRLPHQEAIAQMLNDPETQKVIKRIAKERVRCNFLLATYQLPDMNFALNTQIETLQQQFRERLKQRREKAVAAAAAAAATTSTNTNHNNKGIVRARQPQS